MLLGGCGNVSVVGGGNSAGNPVPVISSVAPPAQSADGSAVVITVNGSSFVGASVVKRDGTSLATTYVSNTQLIAQVPIADLPSSGPTSVTVTVVTPAPGGGTSNAAVVQITNPAPSIASLSPSVATIGSSAFVLNVSGNGFVANSSVAWNGQPLATTYVSDTQLSAQIPASAVASVGTANVTVVTPAPGGGSSGPAIFDIDSTSPVPAISSLAPSAATAGSGAFTLTVNGSGFGTDSVVNWNGTPLVTTLISASQLSAPIPAGDIASVGTASVTVVTPAPGGGTSGGAVFGITSTSPLPAIASLSPATATVGGGPFTLTVSGSGFLVNSVVNWNYAPVPTTYVSDTQLTAQIPASDLASVGGASVTVTTPAPGGGNSDAAYFGITSSNPLPSIGSLLPASTSVGGGTFTLTVYGANFVPGSVVRWNGAPLATTYVSGTQLWALVSTSLTQNAGSASVTVTSPSPGGGSSGGAPFTIVATNPAPILVALSPASATAGASAITLTVSGASFTSTSVVRWNGGALPTQFVSDTTLTAQIAGSLLRSAGSAAVSVYTPAPGGGTSSTQTFTISSSNPLPALGALSPSSVTAGSGALTLTVTGSGFVASSVVDWNGAPLPTRFVSDTQLTAQVASPLLSSAGTASVTIASPAPGGGVSAAGSFTINATNPAPRLGSLSPASAAAGSPGFTLTVNGASFVASSVVYWNGTPLPTTVLSSTQLAAQVTASALASAGSASVIVTTPAPGGGSSSAAAFSITAVNPAPTLAALAPASVTAGSGSFTVTASGANFVNGSVLYWNGTALPTTVLSATQVAAQVGASLVASAGTANVIVTTPAPGGGSSGAQTFTINSTGTGGRTGGTPKLVQYNTYQTAATAGEGISTLRFNAPTTAGSTIWVVVTCSDYAGPHTETHITDSQGNVYTKLDEKDDGAPGSQSVFHFYAANIAGDTGSPNVVTVNWGYENYKGILITEISGTSSAPLVGHAANIQDGVTGLGDAISAGPVAAGSPPALVIALSMNTSGGASDTGGSGFGAPSAGSGFSQQGTFWNWGVALASLETQTVSGGSVSALFNAPDRTDDYVTVVAAFR